MGFTFRITKQQALIWDVIGSSKVCLCNRSENGHYWHFRMRYANIRKNYWVDDWEFEDLEERA